MVELLLSKSQKSGLMGGITFVLNVRAKLTDEETELVRRYKLGKILVYEKLPVSDAVASMSGGRAFLTAVASKAFKLQMMVDNLVGGRMVECKDIGEMIAAHEQIEQAAENFYNLLMASKNFEGEEVITYPRP